MATRWLPLSFLLLSQTIPAHADLKIVMRQGVQRSTRYLQGRKSRTEAGDAFGPQAVWIFNGDRQLQYGLDPARRTYTVRPVEPWKPNPLLRVRESGKVIDIYRDYVDTGERRWMFGHLARHVILSERRVPAAGSCSAGEGESRTKTDGWYIDLPEPFKGSAFFGLAGGMACPDGAIDRTVTHTTGLRESGFPLLETTTQPGWPHAVWRTKVVEWDESPLDPKLFVPPTDFRQVSDAPHRRHDSFLDSLRYRLSNYVSAAEGWIE